MREEGGREIKRDRDRQRDRNSQTKKRDVSWSSAQNLTLKVKTTVYLFKYNLAFLLCTLFEYIFNGMLENPSPFLQSVYFWLACGFLLPGIYMYLSKFSPIIQFHCPSSSNFSFSFYSGCGHDDDCVAKWETTMLYAEMIPDIFWSVAQGGKHQLKNTVLLILQSSTEGIKKKKQISKIVCRLGCLTFFLVLRCRVGWILSCFAL